MADQGEAAYAVVRLDLFQEPSLAEAIRAHADSLITVREVLPTWEEAAQEAERLNELHPDGSVFYFCQGTHLFPNGRNVQRGY